MSTKPSLSSLAKDNDIRQAWSRNPLSRYWKKATVTLALALAVSAAIGMVAYRMQDIEGWDTVAAPYWTYVVRSILIALAVCLILRPVGWIYARATFNPDAPGEILKEDPGFNPSYGSIALHSFFGVAAFFLANNAVLYWVYLYTGKTFRYWISPYGHRSLRPFDVAFFRIWFWLFNINLVVYGLVLLYRRFSRQRQKAKTAAMLAWANSQKFPIENLGAVLASDKSCRRITFHYKEKRKAPPIELAEKAFGKFNRPFDLDRSDENHWIEDCVRFNPDVEDISNLHQRLAVIVEALEAEYPLSKIEINP